MKPAENNSGEILFLNPLGADRGDQKRKLRRAGLHLNKSTVHVCARLVGRWLKCVCGFDSHLNILLDSVMIYCNDFSLPCCFRVTSLHFFPLFNCVNLEYIRIIVLNQIRNPIQKTRLGAGGVRFYGLLDWTVSHELHPRRDESKKKIKIKKLCRQNNQKSITTTRIN